MQNRIIESFDNKGLNENINDKRSVSNTYYVSLSKKKEKID